LKLEKNRTERWKTDPTSTNSLEMIFGKVGVAVRSTHNTLHIVTNERTKMRRDLVKRKFFPVAMKLEDSANNNTERFLSPDETRRSTKFASIESTESTSHVLSDVCIHAITKNVKKHFNFIGHMSRKKTHTLPYTIFFVLFF